MSGSTIPPVQLVLAKTVRLVVYQLNLIINDISPPIFYENDLTILLLLLN